MIDVVVTVVVVFLVVVVLVVLVVIPREKPQFRIFLKYIVCELLEHLQLFSDLNIELNLHGIFKYPRIGQLLFSAQHRHPLQLLRGRVDLIYWIRYHVRLQVGWLLFIYLLYQHI